MVIWSNLLKTKLKHLFVSAHRCAGFYDKKELYVSRDEPFRGPDVAELVELSLLN